MTKSDIIRSIPGIEKLYVIYSRLTHLPYMEKNIELLDNQIYVFTDETQATTRAQSLTANGRQPAIAIKIDKPHMLKMFSELYAYGVDALIFQNGSDYYRLMLNEIVRQPDFSRLPANKRPLLNPQFQLSMIYYLQEFRKGGQAADKQPLAGMGQKMMLHMMRAPYLLSFKESGNKGGEKNLQLVYIKGTGGAPLVPVFSDAIEYNRFKGQQDLKASLTDFTRLSQMRLPEEIAGFIINPAGVAFPLSNDYLHRAAIQQLLKSLSQK